MPLKKEKIKLQVVCLVYNHEKFIRDALDGFLSQKTNFKFEVLIGDDCSTDNTSSIVREYVEKYPELFKYFRRSKNIGAQLNSYDLLKRVDAEYLALCEGDDYWTDENKLQKQVDFLDSHPHINGVFHNAEIKKEPEVKSWNSDFWFIPDEQGRQFWPTSIKSFDRNKKFYDICDVLEGIIATASIVYRVDPNFILPNWFKTAIAGDRPLHCMMVKSGRFAYIDEVMSVYRVQPSGAWFNKNSKKVDVKEISDWVSLLENINRYFNGQYKSLFDLHKYTTITNGIKRAISQQDTNSIYELIKLYPVYFYDLVKSVANSGVREPDFYSSEYKVKILGMPLLKIKETSRRKDFYFLSAFNVFSIKRIS